MQPHLKKCFEGIAKLMFTEEQHVKGMISSEKENVPFSKTIIPADAKVCLAVGYASRMKTWSGLGTRLTWSGLGMRLLAYNIIHTIIILMLHMYDAMQGMVEKWLLQVQETMILSLQDVTKESVVAYEEKPRDKWVLEWPGQVVIAASTIYWTRDVTDAIEHGTLQACLDKSNRQIDQIVELVRGKLTSMARITLGALTVIDVHGKEKKKQNQFWEK